MRKIDINQYGKSIKLDGVSATGGKITFSRIILPGLKIFFKFFITLFSIMLLTSTLILFSLNMYKDSLLKNDIALNINASKVPLTSFIYANDENGVAQEYQRVYSGENRIWIDFSEIPQYMKDAIVAIEDKRFYDHQGVDFKRTFGAAMNFTKGSKSYGGSTLTQQLIKNITEDNEVSLLRKVREIFRAIELEKMYSKDEILESYLNIVNFGAGSRGVETAANIYFGKSIKDCSLAQCATIASITQNPSAYNPFYHPENNKLRRETVLREMLEQEKISSEEFQNAMKESESMVFTDKHEDFSKSKKAENNNVRNWYVETVIKDVINELCEKYSIGKSTAEDMIYSQGLKIYAAVDLKAQAIVEDTIKNKSVMPSDENLEMGFSMIDLNGRLLATLGSRKEKTGNLLYDRANYARRQPGSTIKPLAAYTPVIEAGMYNYSSLIPDEPLQVPTAGGGTKPWPNNWYKSYKGKVTLQWALEKSANAPPAQLVKMLTPMKSYEFLTKKLGFTSLDAEDASSIAPLATGGTHYGVTPREMAGAFQIFGNGGKFYKPYSYFYVTDRNDKVLLDHRDDVPIQAISSQTATIMNKLLRNVVTGPEGTGRAANIEGWNVIGKTGTTNDDFDSWFIGETPYAIGAIWTGYDNPRRIKETPAAIKIWKHIMTQYLKDKEHIDYNYDPEVISAGYCKSSGNLAALGCSNTAIGWYSRSNMPPACTGHYNCSVEPKKESNNSESQNSEHQAINDSNSSRENTSSESQSQSQSQEQPSSHTDISEQSTQQSQQTTNSSE